jgi:hypothetical protein
VTDHAGGHVIGTCQPKQISNVLQHTQQHRCFLWQIPSWYQAKVLCNDMRAYAWIHFVAGVEAREQLRRQVGTLRFDLNTLAQAQPKDAKKKALELKKVRRRGHLDESSQDWVMQTASGLCGV